MRLSSFDVHAFQAVGYLAAHPNRWITAAELCQQTGLTRPFTVRILASLVRGQVVTSKKGASGGYRLAHPASAITLRDVIRALERPVAPLSCVSLSAPCACPHEAGCGIRRSVYEELREATHAILARYTAVDLAGDVHAGVAYTQCLLHLWHPQIEQEALGVRPAR